MSLRINSDTISKLTHFNKTCGISCFAIVGGLSCVIVGMELNDFYCFNVLNQNQYKSINVYYGYYKAKYTNLFLNAMFAVGLIGGGAYGYKGMPLLLNE
jgi:hypothetical protein